MNKELPGYVFVLAMILLLVIPLVGIIYVRGMVNPASPATPWLSDGPITKPPTNFILELANPDDELLTFDRSLIISGKTSPKAQIIIADNDDNWNLEANQNGDFSKVIDLNPGLNQIIVSGADKMGDSKQIERTVFYSEDKL